MSTSFRSSLTTGSTTSSHAALSRRTCRRSRSVVISSSCAHDGFPSNLTGGPFPSYKAWFDHYLLGENDGVTGDSNDVKPTNADTPGVDPVNQPPVDLFLSNGSREQILSGNWTNISGAEWPLPDTAWTDLSTCVQTGNVI